MKGTILFLLCAITHGSLLSTFDNGCPKDTTIEKVIPHENCDQFYQCLHGVLIARFCPSGLHYNPKLEKCDWPAEAKCRYKIEDENTNKHPEHSEELDNNNPSHADAICSSIESNNVLIAHENCNQFYKCSFGKPIALKCATSLLYNPMNEKCDWPQKVDCGERLITVKEDTNQYLTKHKPISRSVNEENDGNFDPSLAPALCAVGGSDGVLVAHETCNKFYKCFGGQPVALKCPVHLLYNPSKEYCDWPRNVYCGDRVISEKDDNNIDNGNSENDAASNEIEGEDIDSGEGSDETINKVNSDPSQASAICASPNSEGILIAHKVCNKFYKCSGSRPVALLCPGNLLYNPTKGYCDWQRNVYCGDRFHPDREDSNESDESNNSGEGGNHGDPSQASAICATTGSDGILVAHNNCNQFYKCHDGLPKALKCPGILLYNSSHEYCDWPTNVDCGNRVIPETFDENDNDGESGDLDYNGHNHSNPSEASAICAVEKSDGILVAHENCNQFNKCFDGKPIALFCQLNLLYNPKKELCDWPHNVECGDRVRFDPNENNAIVDESTESSEVTTPCANKPDGDIVPHENCSQFYKCLSGNPQPVDCPPGLYYNTTYKICDWPVNVDCGNRLTDSQKVAHKHSRRGVRLLVRI